MLYPQIIETKKLYPLEKQSDQIFLYVIILSIMSQSICKSQTDQKKLAFWYLFIPFKNHQSHTITPLIFLQILLYLAYSAVSQLFTPKLDGLRFQPQISIQMGIFLAILICQILCYSIVTLILDQYIYICRTDRGLLEQ